MLSCDYNGWADVPEEEREGLDVFESGHELACTPVDLSFLIQAKLTALRIVPEPRAA
jgi:hypothetical protein